MLEPTNSDAETELTPLQRHVAAFASKLVEKEGGGTEIHYAPTSLTKTLASLDSPMSSVKGPLINTFNSFHTGNATCPFMSGVLPADPKERRAALHLGTARVWDENFNIDEDRWNALTAACVTQHSQLGEIITKAALLTYINRCTLADPEEKNTGRHGNYMGPFRYASVNQQHSAAVQAWGEVFESMRSGKLDTGEPYLTCEDLRLFYQDTGALVQKRKAEKASEKERKYLPGSITPLKS